VVALEDRDDVVGAGARKVQMKAAGTFTPRCGG
jgi:hypothetical protein